MTKKEWHNEYFQNYVDIIYKNCHDSQGSLDKEKRMRLMKKLISWQTNFDNINATTITVKGR